VTETAFTLGVWRDFTTYKCTLCEFDCMDEEQARKHFQDHFRVPSEELKDLSLIVDGSGHVVSVARE